MENQTNTNIDKPIEKALVKSSEKSMDNTKKSGSRRFEKPVKVKSEFEQKVLDMRRVARVVSGGRRFSFRATVAIGDKKGRVGVGTAKSVDVTSAIEKAIRQAKKKLVIVNMHKNTIPHEVAFKFKSGKIMLKPSKPGNGIVAGGAVRVICSMAGIKDVTGKILGKSSNQINNSLATLGALSRLKPARVRNKSIKS